MNTTRRKFIGMLGAATAIGSTTAFEFAGDTEFREIDRNEYYVLRSMGDNDPEAIVKQGQRWENAFLTPLLDYTEVQREKVFRGANHYRTYLVPVRHMDTEYGDANKIAITEAWLREFWRRHKEDAVV